MPGWACTCFRPQRGRPWCGSHLTLVLKHSFPARFSKRENSHVVEHGLGPPPSGHVTVDRRSISLPLFPIYIEGRQQCTLYTAPNRPNCENLQVAHSSWLVSDGCSFISFTVFVLYTYFNCNLALKSPFGFSLFFDFLFAYEFSCALWPALGDPPVWGSGDTHSPPQTSRWWPHPYCDPSKPDLGNMACTQPWFFPKLLTLM